MQRMSEHAIHSSMHAGEDVLCALRPCERAHLQHVVAEASAVAPLGAQQAAGSHSGSGGAAHSGSGGESHSGSGGASWWLLVWYMLVPVGAQWCGQCLLTTLLQHRAPHFISAARTRAELALCNQLVNKPIAACWDAQPATQALQAVLPGLLPLPCQVSPRPRVPVPSPACFSSLFPPRTRARRTP